MMCTLGALYIYNSYLLAKSISFWLKADTVMPIYKEIVILFLYSYDFTRFSHYQWFLKEKKIIKEILECNSNFLLTSLWAMKSLGFNLRWHPAVKYFINILLWILFCILRKKSRITTWGRFFRGACNDLNPL